MSLLLPLKSLAEEVNRLTKYSRILAARSKLLTVSYVLPLYLLNQHNIMGFPAVLGLTHIFIIIHRQCRSPRKKRFSDRVTRFHTVSWCSYSDLKHFFHLQLLHSAFKDRVQFIGSFCSWMSSFGHMLRNNTIKLLPRFMAGLIKPHVNVLICH